MIKYDLILTVVNRGYADEVMKAAKKAGAFGGTVLNAREEPEQMNCRSSSVRLFSLKRIS